MDGEKPGAKKRGRKKLTDDEKAERKFQRSNQNGSKSESRPEVSYVCTEKTSVTSAPKVMQASEVISLLNSSIATSSSPQGAITLPIGISTSTPSGSNMAHQSESIIPIRNSAATPVYSHVGSMLLDESDSDEESGIRHLPQPRVEDTCPDSILFLLGAHTNVNEWPLNTDKL